MRLKMNEYLPKIRFITRYGKYTSMNQSRETLLNSFHKHRKMKEMETFQTIAQGVNLSYT